MAKPAAKTKKKIKRVVTDGVAHVHASFNNTIVTITDLRATLCRGRPPVALASAVRASRPRSQPRWLPKRPVVLRWTTA